MIPALAEQKLQIVPDPHTEEILDFFAEKLRHRKRIGLPSQKDPCLEVIRRIDDWWFVPRVELPTYEVDRKTAEGRLAASLAQYLDTGTLPEYFKDAYRFAQHSKYSVHKWFWG